jgi:hypothetical protein
VRAHHVAVDPSPPGRFACRQGGPRLCSLRTPERLRPPSFPRPRAIVPSSQSRLAPGSPLRRRRPRRTRLQLLAARHPIPSFSIVAEKAGWHRRAGSEKGNRGAQGQGGRTTCRGKGSGAGPGIESVPEGGDR